MRKPKVKRTTLERAIWLRERGIARLKQRQESIRQDAEEDCAAIDKLIATRRVLLDAIKAGSLRP